MLTVLRRRGVRYLLATSFVGRLPAAMSALALVRLVVDDGGSYGYASVLSSAYIVAGMAGQPLLARAVDRTGQRRLVLLAASVIATAGFIVTGLTVGTPVAAVAAAAVAGLATPPIESTLRSLWTTLFSSPRDLGSAYAVDAAVQESGFIVGPLVTAVGIAAFGTQGNVILMAAIGLAGGTLFAAHPRLARVVVPPRAHGTEHGSPLTSPAFRRILLVVVGISAPVGCLAVLATAYGERHGTPGLGAWAVALNATGALCGALLMARFPLRVPPARAILPLAVGLAALYLPLALSVLPPAGWLTAAFLSGPCLPPLLTQIYAQTTRAVRASHANEANAWVVSAFSIGATVGTLLAGFAVDAAGMRGIALAIVTASLAAGLAATAAARPDLLSLEHGAEGVAA